MASLENLYFDNMGTHSMPKIFKVLDHIQQNHSTKRGGVMNVLCEITFAAKSFRENARSPEDYVHRLTKTLDTPFEEEGFEKQVLIAVDHCTEYRTNTVQKRCD